MKGANEPKAENLNSLASALQVSPVWLLGYDVPMERVFLKEIGTSKIPVLGRISAGLPMFAEEHIEGYEYAPSTYIKEGNNYFYLKVHGDSMNLKFNDDDLVLVQKQDTLENGDIGVILVNGYDATVKRYKEENNLIMLEPMSTNPENTVQVYDPRKIKIKVIGKVVAYQGKI